MQDLPKTANNEPWLEGLLYHDYSVLEAIYEKCLPPVVRMVAQNGGTNEDAEDIFQEGLLILYRKACNRELTLYSNFSCYLSRVCHFLWLRELKKRRRRRALLEAHAPNGSAANGEGEASTGSRERLSLFWDKIGMLPGDSQIVLSLFFQGESMENIAHLMGYSPQYAKRKKYKSKNKLIQLVQEDPRYRELKEPALGAEG